METPQKKRKRDDEEENIQGNDDGDLRHKETQHLILSSRVAGRPEATSGEEAKERFTSPTRNQMHEVAGLQQFNTRIVDRKFTAGRGMFVCKNKGTALPSSTKKWDVRNSIQKRDLPVFNVRVIPKPSLGAREGQKKKGKDAR